LIIGGLRLLLSRHELESTLTGFARLVLAHRRVVLSHAIGV
jgi:hypothetical protein